MTPDISATPPLTGPGWSTALAHLESTRSSVWRTAVLRGGQRLCPSPSQVFAALECDFAGVSVVIVGQDPYPNQHDAIGRAFGVPADTPRLPPTLRNIARELASDIGCDWLSSCRWPSSTSSEGGLCDVGGPPSLGSSTSGAGTYANHPTDSLTGSKVDPRLAPGTGTGGPHVDSTLSLWQEQGVLLLNRVLTCEQGMSNAHEHLGWQEFTQGVIDALVERRQPLVGILWGRQAQRLAPRFMDAPVLVAAHPSPLSARHGFFGSRPFTSCNRLLAAQGHPGVHWC